MLTESNYSRRRNSVRERSRHIWKCTEHAGKINKTGNSACVMDREPGSWEEWQGEAWLLLTPLWYTFIISYHVLSELLEK